MPQLRPWIPRPVKDAVRAVAPIVTPAQQEAIPRDLAFCSELAFHGGVAVREQGFQAEQDLVRMRDAGLLELKRNEAAPFAVTRVALSQKARDILAGRGRGSVAASGKDPPLPPADPKPDKMSRRNGFEVARGMISVAVKAELASWKAAGEPGGVAGLEVRVMARIGRIEVPFLA